MLSKRRYVAIASELARCQSVFRIGSPEVVPSYLRATKHIANALADYFASDNPRFDRVRFLEACGVEPSE